MSPRYHSLDNKTFFFALVIATITTKTVFPICFSGKQLITRYSWTFLDLENGDYSTGRKVPSELLPISGTMRSSRAGNTTKFERVSRLYPRRFYILERPRHVFYEKSLDLSQRNENCLQFRFFFISFSQNAQKYIISVKFEKRQKEVRGILIQKIAIHDIFW